MAQAHAGSPAASRRVLGQSDRPGEILGRLRPLRGAQRGQPGLAQPQIGIAVFLVQLDRQGIFLRRVLGLPLIAPHVAGRQVGLQRFWIQLQSRLGVDQG